MDLVVSIDMTKTDGRKRVGHVHMRRKWGERAEIWLNAHTLHGETHALMHNERRKRSS